MAAFEPFRVLRRDIAFVEDHFAGAPHLDIDAPALALGRFAILPCREIVAARNDDDIGPSGVEIILAARLDHHILCGPEGIAIGKILLLAEQVADDLALVIAKEQYFADSDRSEAHTSELQSLMRSSNAVFC